jgi:Skp family chaperone for outer membrane proteins
MTFGIKLGRLLLAVGTLIAVSVAAEAGSPPQPPQPKILVIDRQAIVVRSAAGQSIINQARALDLQMQNQLKSQANSLRSQYAQMQQQSAILSSELKAKKMRDLEAQRAALEQKVQQSQSLIQGGVLQARQQIGDALGPILKGIMASRGANMLLDRGAVVFSTVDIDITAIAIQQLNQKLPNVKVTPTPLPPGVQPQ